MICARLLSQFSLRELFRELFRKLFYKRYIFADKLPDRRLHAYRSDLIDERLRGSFPDAPSSMFIAGECRSIIDARVYLRRGASFSSAIDTELFYGNEVRCFASKGSKKRSKKRGKKEDWSWVQSKTDGYVGYVPSSALGSVMANNAIVSVALCLCYREASATSESFFALPMGSRLLVGEDFVGKNSSNKNSSGDGFLRTRICGEEGYISERHIISSDDLLRRDIDFISTAEFFLGVPYLYGGGSYVGMDCSALLQTAMSLHGIECPRDTDMQEGRSGEKLLGNAALGNSLGRSLGITDGASVDVAMRDLRRGDLIFWHSHVGIMLDGENFLHVNAEFMCVSVEGLREARARIMGIEGEIRTIRRLERIR